MCKTCKGEKLQYMCVCMYMYMYTWVISILYMCMYNVHCTCKSHQRKGYKRALMINLRLTLQLYGTGSLVTYAHLPNCSVGLFVPVNQRRVV